MSVTVIGITGGSGSGKTCFVRDLAAKFNQDEVCFLHQDNYYKPIELQEKDQEGIANFDLPNSIFLDKFAADIMKLKSGESLTLKEYTFNNRESQSRDIHVHPAPIIIAEGLFLFHHEPIRDLLDLSIIIHADDSSRIIRRIKRDRTERNYPLEDVLYRYDHHVMPSYRKFIFPYFSEADMVVNNNDNYSKSLEVIEAYCKSLLSSE